MALGARLQSRPRRSSMQTGDVPARLSRRRRVLILSSNVGEGHAAAARALALHLEEHDPDTEVAVIDGLAAMGELIRRVVQDGYQAQLRVAPWSADLVYWLLLRLPPARLLARFLLRRIGMRKLQRVIESHDPDIVVSTYPAVTIMLGMMRRRGRLRVPSAAAITDLAGLFFWADRGVDLHLLAYEESIPEVEKFAGRGSAVVARGLVAPHFEQPNDPATARAALGLPDSGRVVIVSGGGWGIGDLAGSIREALTLEDVNVVVLAGRNEECKTSLERAFADDSRVRVLGFTTQINDLLAAADAMVHSTAGVTCLEARARGCPVVVYGAQIAHIRVNAREMARREIVDVALSPSELRVALERALEGGGARIRAADPFGTPAAATLLADARIRVRPPSRVRVALPRVAISAIATLAPVWTFVSPSALGLRTISSVPTSQREVALVVRAPSQLIGQLQARMQATGMDASFAVNTDPGTISALRAAGADGLPDLKPSGTVHWLRVGGELRSEARALGLRHHFYYLRPRGGFSLAEYFMASRAGGRAVSPRVIDRGISRRPLHRGDVLVLDVPREPAAAAAAIDRARGELAGAGLSAVALDSLLPGAH
jgi:processive 1,2-diacylglycerol beta-glucosyltransferase